MKIIETLKRKYAEYKGGDKYLNFLRGKGIRIGERCTIGPARTITIDCTRPYLVEIGDDVRLNYGLTEASRSSFQEFHDIEHLDSIGKPTSSNVDIKIFDKEGNEVEHMIPGEICVKGNMVLEHYLEEKDNVSAFHGPYFRTGDNGYMNSDGYIYIVGREKEMINVGGKKVSPAEVEDAIISLGVKDCVCIGEKDEANILGETIKCYILKNSTELTFKEISDLIGTRIEKYKCPTTYEWIDEIPYTESGKKQRLKLK